MMSLKALLLLVSCHVLATTAYSHRNCDHLHCNHGDCRIRSSQGHPDHAFCECDDGWTGTSCNIVACNLNCNNGDCQIHHSHSHPDKHFCKCQDGWIGSHCDIADPCITQPCQNGGICHHKAHNPYFQCECTNNFLGDTCKDDQCTSAPCKNGGRCRTFHGHHSSGYECICHHGFTGVQCESLITTTKGTTSTPATTGTSSSALTANTFVNMQTTVPVTSHPETTKAFTKVTPVVNHTCSKYNSLFDVAEKVIEINQNASECTSGNRSSPEAYVLAHCDVGPVSFWKQGVNVMEWCDHIPSYTPIAAFDHGGFQQGTCFSGVFVGCLPAKTGIKLILQRCDQTPNIVHITNGQFNYNPSYYYTIE